MPTHACVCVFTGRKWTTIASWKFSVVDWPETTRLHDIVAASAHEVGMDWDYWNCVFETLMIKMDTHNCQNVYRVWVYMYAFQFAKK